jgi:hypothetical protein
MRDRSFGTAKRPQPSRFSPPRLDGHAIGPSITRLYEPKQIDVDELAEAIRGLIGRPGEANPAHCDLLSGHRRGTHGVGADHNP